MVSNTINIARLCFTRGRSTTLALQKSTDGHGAKHISSCLTCELQLKHYKRQQYSLYICCLSPEMQTLLEVQHDTNRTVFWAHCLTVISQEKEL